MWMHVYFLALSELSYCLLEIVYNTKWKSQFDLQAVVYIPRRNTCNTELFFTHNSVIFKMSKKLDKTVPQWPRSIDWFLLCVLRVMHRRPWDVAMIWPPTNFLRLVCHRHNPQSGSCQKVWPAKSKYHLMHVYTLFF